jgi:hypothetical protein
VGKREKRLQVTPPAGVRSLSGGSRRSLGIRSGSVGPTKQKPHDMLQFVPLNECLRLVIAIWLSGECRTLLLPIGAPRCGLGEEKAIGSKALQRQAGRKRAGAITAGVSGLAGVGPPLGRSLRLWLAAGSPGTPPACRAPARVDVTYTSSGKPGFSGQREASQVESTSQK